MLNTSYTRRETVKYQMTTQRQPEIFRVGVSCRGRTTTPVWTRRDRVEQTIAMLCTFDILILVADLHLRVSLSLGSVTSAVAQDQRSTFAGA